MFLDYSNALQQIRKLGFRFLIVLFFLYQLAQIPLFLYPFLNTYNKSKQFEYLRLTALGVFGELVKV